MNRIYLKKIDVHQSPGSDDISPSVQGHVGWGFGQHDLVEGIPTHVMVVGAKVPSNTNSPMIL